MEKIFAIINDNTVINIVTADTKESADALYRDYFSVEISDLTEKPFIGIKYIQGTFIFPKEAPEEGV